jgi:class 3 adenylate cyclase/tetratricopeptide (TPR) repeat protein
MVADHHEHREQTLMFSDIVGYSRLMGRDEALTIEMLGDYRKILLAHIAEHNGVFIEFAGDAIFSRFDSALSAVKAAVAIQKHLQLFNQGRDKELPRLQTRIGIHKGMVLLRENAVLGDDVNIAARLEPLAVPDGICISKAIYDDIKIDIREPIKALGLQSLKNIQHKIRAYLIKPSGIKTRDHFHYFWLGCSKKINAYRYPISAAVLALFIAGFYFIPRWLVPGYAANYVEIANFQNLMNADGKSDYFSSGITEAVRSQLADMRDVYIVDADKGVHAPIRLEGSVQKIGDNLRIAYRIFRRDGNVQIAGGKLDGAYEDIFILQDRLVGDIARNLAAEFKLQNFRPAPLKLTNDITAYDYYLQGMDSINKPSSQKNYDDAIQSFSQALVHDNRFILANHGLCEAYRLKYELLKTLDSAAKAENYCLKALSLGENSSKVYASLGALYREKGLYKDALHYLQTAKEKEPGNIDTIIALAGTYDLMQQKKNAEALFKEAIKESPKNWATHQEYGYFLIHEGRYEEAINSYKNVLRLTPDNVVTLNNIGATFLFMGQFEKAEYSLKKAIDIEPNGLAFSNLGVMNYYLGKFNKAVEYGQEAIKLEPTNIQYLNNVSDAYFFLNDRVMADEFSKKVRFYAEQTVSNDQLDISGHLYLALTDIHFGKFTEAKEKVYKAAKLNPNNFFTYYVALRIATAEENDSDIEINLQKLKDRGYSPNLILDDPYFAKLKDDRFKDFIKNY